MSAFNLTGCNEEKGVSTSKPNETIIEQKSSKQSGYAGSVEDWRKFLGCWKSHYPAPAGNGQETML
jgi:hypothetical protein